MAFRISLGSYVPADSVLHRLDPRSKIVCGLAIMVSVFFIRTPLQLAFGWLVALGLVLMSRLPTGKVLSSIKPVIMVLLVLSVFNLLLVNTGTTLVAVGPLRITTGGLWAAVNYSLRLVVAVIAATLILLTTTPTQLTDAFDAASMYSIPAMSESRSSASKSTSTRVGYCCCTLYRSRTE